MSTKRSDFIYYIYKSNLHILIFILNDTSIHIPLLAIIFFEICIGYVNILSADISLLIISQMNASKCQWTTLYMNAKLYVYKSSVFADVEFLNASIKYLHV